MDKVQLHLIRQHTVAFMVAGGASSRKRADILYGLSHLSDVLFDEILGAREGSVVQLWGSYIAEIPHKTGSKEINQLLEVAILSRNGQRVQPLRDESPIVVFRRRIVPPAELSARCLFRASLWV